MKKIIVVLAVIALLALAQVGQAVDLQAGWYVKLGGIVTFGTDPQTHTGISTQWHFISALSDCGPFRITSPDPIWAERMVSVPVSANGVSPGTSVYLWSQPDNPVNYEITEVVFPWESNYDTSKMVLELLMYNPSAGYTTLWSQVQSQYNSGFDNVLTFPQKIPFGNVPVLRVSVVPEPNGLIILLTGGGALLRLIRRKK